MKDFFKYMMACICAIFLVNIFVILIFLLSLIGMAATSGSSTSVKDNSVYQIDLDGILEERATEDPMGAIRSAMSFAEKEKVLGLQELIANIKKAKENEKIVGIYLHGGELSGGLASFRELRRALEDFSESGKFIIAYADTYGQANYYMASVADSLFVNPYGSINWRGLSTTISFYKNIADNLGIDIQVFRVGTYKSAVEPFMLTQMSEANRHQNEVMLGELWDVMCSETGESRGISADSLKAYADYGMELADAELLVEKLMADRLVYEADMDSILAHAAGTKDYNILTHSRMNNVEEKIPSKSDNKIAIVYAEGDIVDDGNGGIVGDDMVETLKDVADDEDVKAVVLRVNSPGGSAFASEKIWYALQQLKHKKPVVVSMGDYAASGGYYISCGADSIFAQPTTITGSIGVFGIVPNFKRLADRVGITHDNVKTSRYANINESLAIGQPTDDEKALVQASIERTYDLFTRRCAAGRGVPQEDIFEIGGGRVWTGIDALELNLVDKLGYIEDAVQSAATLAELEDYKVAYYPEPQTWQQRLLEALEEENIVARHIKSRLTPEYMQLVDVLTNTEKYSGTQARLLQQVNF